MEEPRCGLPPSKDPPPLLAGWKAGSDSSWFHRQVTRDTHSSEDSENILTGVSLESTGSLLPSELNDPHAKVARVGEA